MKIVLALSVIILLGSCGKYERPFISFKSPEKRLTQHTWRCVKAVDSSGNEFEVFDHITFRIDGQDSIFERQTDYFPLKPAFLTPTNQDQFQIDSATGMATITGNWTWAFALGDNYNKQIMKNRLPYFDRNNYITVLSNKELVFQDQTFDNTTYHYAPL